MKGSVKYVGIGILVGFGLACGFLGERHRNFKIIPRIEKVQEGFVVPSKLEIDCKNLDATDKLPETYVKLGNKHYLFKHNEEGHPVCLEYDFIPSKVVPRK